MLHKIDKLAASAPQRNVAARNALDVRLKDFRARLAAANKAPDNARNVHQLRVAARRVLAAWELFDELMPPRRGNWIWRKIRRVQRAAGTARNLDVLLASRASSTRANGRAIPAELRATIAADRRRAGRRIERVYAKLKAKHFRRRLNKLLGKLRWRGSGPAPAFDAAVRLRLTALADEFAAVAGRTNRADPKSLHELRAVGKRLRYALEIGASAIQSSLDEIYRELKGLQESLGRVSDRATAAKYFDSLATSDPPDIGRASNGTGRAKPANPAKSLASRERRALEFACRQFQKEFPRRRLVSLHRRLRRVLGSVARAHK